MQILWSKDTNWYNKIWTGGEQQFAKDGKEE